MFNIFFLLFEQDICEILKLMVKILNNNYYSLNKN